MDHALMPAAAALHVVEEYVYPGGFLDVMRETSPKYGRHATPLFAVVINGLFVFLCLLAAVFGTRRRLFGLSVLSLLLLNSFAHVAGTVARRRYNPGIATALLLYVPIAVRGYRKALASGECGPRDIALSLAIAAGYYAVPLVSLVAAEALERRAAS